MLVVDPLLPENAFLPLQFQNSFTYAILIFCIQFTLFYLLFTQTKTKKYLFHKTRILSCYLERYLALLLSIFSSRVIRLHASCSLWDRYSYFETSYKRCALGTESASVGGGGAALEVARVPAVGVAGVGGAVAGEGLGFFGALRLIGRLLQETYKRC